jgi:hypothetical protein
MIILAIVTTSIPSLGIPAYAHKPLEAENNNKIENSLQIPNPRVSWVIYKQIQAGDVNYYRFNASTGDRFYAEMDIPKIDRLLDFSPSIILVGKGLDKNLVKGQNIIVREIKVPTSLPVQDSDALAIDYVGTIPSRQFYEEFSQTTFWQRQKFVIDSMPTNSTYYLMVASKGQDGKYALAIGEIEEFGPSEFITVLPRAWFQTKFFFEDYVTPSFVIAIVIVVPAITAIIFAKRKKYTIRSKAKPS